MLEYKVVTAQDSRTGRFDPGALQTTLNDHAAPCQPTTAPEAR